MKATITALAMSTALFGASAIAAQDDMKHDTHGAAHTQGSAMNENHQRNDTANVGANDKTMDEKMKNEVQDDWREDAKERRDADVSKPEQR
ncbi:hypothetical protein MST27_04155 [Pseudomonas sp. PS1]|uniref:Pentapeptide MXKDX repeat protein n=1 Tax=Stutzerimonas marianensis TaxID=2929513 RepID=A0A9X1W015_9GAMM|nr:hypothetical protein [Pseudomonas marianensis]MCJ0972566.1 hypothetical protein [Pseudomonas marianensis]